MHRKTLCFTSSHTSRVLYNDYTPVLLHISMTSMSVPLSIRQVLACLQSGTRNRPPRILILTERHTPRDLVGFMQSSTLLTLLPKYLQHPPAVTALTVETLCRSFQKTGRKSRHITRTVLLQLVHSEIFFPACNCFSLATS